MPTVRKATPAEIQAWTPDHIARRELELQVRELQLALQRGERERIQLQQDLANLRAQLLRLSEQLRPPGVPWRCDHCGSDAHAPSMRDPHRCMRCARGR